MPFSCVPFSALAGLEGEPRERGRVENEFVGGNRSERECIMRTNLFACLVVMACPAPIGYLVYQFILDQQRLTWRDYTKVQDGMTRLQIEEILGPPQRVDAREGGGQKVRWIGRNEGMIYVEFDEQGRMTRKNFTETARDYRLSFFPRIRD
jgi:outer membrane protein assembly factor BamE (lipoprotein component of BamABCDE complex)